MAHHVALALEFRNQATGRFESEAEVKAHPEMDVTFTLKKRKKVARKS